MIRRFANRCALAAVVALSGILSSACAARAQQPIMLLVSRPDDKRGKDGFLDLAPHLDSALRENGKYDLLIFKRDLPAIRTALEMRTIDSKDLTDPLTRDAVHKIAAAVGARYLLTVSAYADKDNMVADATTEMLIGGGLWTTLSSDHMVPGRIGGKKLSLLESVHALVGGLAEKVGAAVSNAPVSNDPGGPTKPTPPNVLSPTDAKPAPGGSAPNTPRADKSQPATPKTGTTVPAANDRTIQPIPRPVGPSTYDLLIDKARRNGDVANLILALRRAITEKPRDVRLRRDLIRAYTDRGWNDLARDEAARAVTLAPNDPALHRLLGDAYLGTGSADQAVKEYQEAVRLDSKDPLSHIALGDAYLATEKPEAALQEYQAAIQGDAKSATAHRRLARVYADRGQYADCTSELGLAKGISPNDDSLAGDLGSVLSVVETSLSDTLARTLAARNDFRSGAKNREETFKALSLLRKKADDLAAFLTGMPDLGFDRIQALYAQAAAMVVQHADKLLDYLETQSTTQDEEATLLRIEANKQIGDADKALKVALAAKRR